MKTITQILIIVGVLCLIEANGRHVENEYEDLAEGEVKTDLTDRMRDHAAQSRHKRRSRQSFGYDYRPPPYFWADHRTEYNVRQDSDYLGQILKSLDEILTYLKRPVPPQPIYIPYPVIQNRPCSCRGVKVCRPVTGKRNETDDDLGNRFGTGDMEDENQNWGLVAEETDYDYGVGDGSRPISFEPVEPQRPLRRPSPPVDHGSNQAGATTQAPVSPPGICETAILTCCSLTDKAATRNCFARYNCIKTYSTNRACDQQVINKVLEHFKQAYAPNRI